MSIAGDIIVIILLFVVFGISHSFLASRELKSRIAAKYGDYIAFYRLGYNIISLISFMLILEIAPRPDMIIYDLNGPYDIIIFALQALSLLGLMWTASSLDWMEFFGISQIKRWYHGTYSIAELDESGTLITRGLYKYSRHPVYLFSILFLALRPEMSLFYLVSLVCIIAYFYIGSLYEEKKLISRFGNEYVEYMNTVPRILPFFFHKK